MGVGLKLIESKGIINKSSIDTVLGIVDGDKITWMNFNRENKDKFLKYSPLDTNVNYDPQAIKGDYLYEEDGWRFYYQNECSESN
ncbi:hypothetical protein ACFL1H_07930 [Nanoarchaeota archaeon]